MKTITRQTCTDEVAALTALTGPIRGWGNAYAYAAESRLLDRLDAFIDPEVWTDGLQKCGGRATQADAQSTLPRAARTVGTCQLGLVGPRPWGEVS